MIPADLRRALHRLAELARQLGTKDDGLLAARALAALDAAESEKAAQVL